MEMHRTIIAEHPFFMGMPPHLVDLLAACAFEERYAAGAYIFHEHGNASRFYLIRDGRVALEAHASSGETMTIETIGAGDVLGWSWFFPPYYWHFAARAVEPVSAIAFDAASLRAQCDADHDLGYELMRRLAAVIVSRLQATRLRLLDLAVAPARVVNGAAGPEAPR